MLALDAMCWVVCARLARRRSWRLLITTFMSAQMIGLAWIILGRLLHAPWSWSVSKFAASVIFIWHFIGLGLFAMICLALLPVIVIRIVVRLTLQRKPKTNETPTEAWTRREFIGFSAAVAPPLFTFSLAGVAMCQLNQIGRASCRE